MHETAVRLTESLTPTHPTLDDIECLDRKLETAFGDKLQIDAALTRQLVSFQANKSRPTYRWYKYKEGFSAALVEHFLHRYGLERGRLLDPFAGSGTALFVAGAAGLDAEGIELLPIGQEIIRARLTLARAFSESDIAALARWRESQPWKHETARVPLTVMRITEHAYPPETVASIEQYLAAILHERESVQVVLRFALLCVLEAISYTRKDGQYLRWDMRSGRRQGKKPFHKGTVACFDEALGAKIAEILADLRADNQQLSLFAPALEQGSIHLHSGSALEIMPALASDAYDVIFTSPPYCNRYDYTRTYALELALLGVTDQRIRKLRQEMLSATVENRAKDLLTLNPDWHTAIQAADTQPLLQAVLTFLDDQGAQGKLNNTGIARMVRGYFYEMACIVAECARVLKPGGVMFMVNDNVRYAGASISVDMILSSIAEKQGLTVEKILVLPNGKGNSSQQMGAHGRAALRKCVYVWRKCPIEPTRSLHVAATTATRSSVAPRARKSGQETGPTGEMQAARRVPLAVIQPMISHFSAFIRVQFQFRPPLQIQDHPRDTQINQ